MRKLITVSAALLLLVLSTALVRAESKYKITPDVIYGHKAGMALTFDVVQPKEPNGAGILFMVSGGWVSMWAPPEAILKPPMTNLFPFFSDLLDKGYTLFLVRHGSSPQFKVPEAVADVRRAARFIHLHAQDYGVDPNRLGVCGGSAGGHLSMMLGTTGDDGKKNDPEEVNQASSKVAAVVAYFGPVDLREWTGPDAPARPKELPLPALDFDPKLAESVSPLLHVTPDDAPTLLVHGDKDTLVTLDNSERILKAFHEKNVEADLLVIEGAGHGFPGESGRRASQALIDWFDKHLAKKTDEAKSESAEKEEAAATP